ncbi:unnamed protein product [Ostreobium quekettii]|uniref:Membrin n=1 Tax=Ostreobium quekettii TaxID=121088 RepID=A0A8S1IT56_9CHLO|nr:unnamed protein product [Ostreobium quekettii]|eukprot:evm.model.scf_1398.1 EVM.evm.TU.scf_1398.1   scf_1398:9232-11640(+)
MSELPALYSQAKRLTIALREGLDRLESTEVAGGSTSAQMQVLRAKFADLQRTSNEVDSVWRMHVLRESHNSRDLWKRKVEQVAEDMDSIRMALDRFGAREDRRARERQEREELLMRRQEGAAVAVQMDTEAQLMGSVQRSKTVLQEAIDMGTNILETMTSNREVLKRAQKRMLDMLNTVGLSESLLRVIERRQKGDIWITYGGMVATVLVLIMVWWFFL